LLGALFALTFWIFSDDLIQAGLAAVCTAIYDTDNDDVPAATNVFSGGGRRAGKFSPALFRPVCTLRE